MAGPRDDPPGGRAGPRDDPPGGRAGVGHGPAVDSVDVAAYTVPTDAPEADGTFAWDSTTMVLARVTAGGVTGLGYTYGPAACARLIGDVLQPLVVGSDPMDPRRTWDAMVHAVRNVGRAGVASMSISAVDLALWDLQARLLGEPLHRLLGAVREVVPVYGSGGFTTYTTQQLADQLQGWLEAGCRWVKIKIAEDDGACTDRDLRRMRQVRGLGGPSLGVFVDANGGYSAPQAVQVLDAAADVGVSWFEEPVSSDDLDGLRWVRERVSADVAAGEYGYDPTYFRRMCQAGAVDCLQVDVTRAGGITGWLEAVAIAAAHDLDVSAHCAPAATLAVAAGTPRLRHIEWFHDHVRLEKMLFDGTVPAVDGGLSPLDLPGNGLALRPGAERFRVA